MCSLNQKLESYWESKEYLNMTQEEKDIQTRRFCKACIPYLATCAALILGELLFFLFK